MMKTKVIIASILGAAMTISSSASAQDKITVNGNIDLVNNYVWRKLEVDLWQLILPFYNKGKQKLVYSLYF